MISPKKCVLLSLTLALGSALPVAVTLAQSSAQAPPPAWEQLPQAHRDALIAPIRERWNRNPDERQRMLERADRWQAMSPDQRSRAHRGMKRWEHMDPHKRAEMQALFERTRGMPPQQRRETFALFHAMRKMTPAGRDTLKHQWQGMSPAQRKAWLQEHAPRRGRRHDH